MFKPTFLSYVI